jgi:hypothetical protein
VGVLDLQSDKLNAFKREDKQVFEAFSDSIATAIHKIIVRNLREVAGLLSANAAWNRCWKAS